MFYVSWFAVSCASVWNTLDYRLLHISGTGGVAVPVFSGTHSFAIDDDVYAKLTTQDFLLEFTDFGLEAGWRRTYVLHYGIGGDVMIRIDPVALQPQGFVHEWIDQPWSEMASRSARDLENWHARLHPADSLFFGQYDFAQPCTERKGFAQIAVEVGEYGKSKTVYFLVRDLGNHSYRMADISYVRQSGCPGETQVDLTQPQPSLFGK